MRRLVHILTFLTAAALLAAACADGGLEANEFEPDCRSNADCSVDQVCVEGYCSVDGRESLELDFRFFPPSETAYRPQGFTMVDIGESERLNFALEPGISIGSGGDNANDPGGILFEDQVEGPTGTLIFSRVGISDSRFSSQVRVTENGFDVLLHPGTYDITFVPDADTLPQKTWREVEFSSSEKWTGRVPSPDSLKPIDGIIHREVRNVAPQKLVSDAKVYATADDGTIVSASTLTDADGKFRLLVEPNVGPYDLHIGPSPANPMLPRAVYEDQFEPTNTGCIDSDGNATECPVNRVTLGEFVREPVDYDVQLQPEDADWSGTTISAVSESFGAGTFERNYTVEPSGRATVTLFPGMFYRVEVIPPPEMRYATTTFDVSLDESTVEFPDAGNLSLEPKKRVIGALVDSHGAPVPFERVEFTPDKTAASSADEDIDMRTIAAQTDENGRFEVFLEGIEHNVDVHPSSGSGLPITRRTLPTSAIRTGSSSVEIRLAEPRVLVGSILANSASAETLGDVGVRAYRRVDGELRIVGEAQSDARGRTRGDYRMVISAELD